MLNIKVLFFANLKNLAGEKQVELELHDEIRVGELKEYLAQRYPPLAAHLKTSIVSVNREFAFDGDLIPQGAEIAIFPPVSGGLVLPTITRVSEKNLDLNALLDEITLPTTGAACLFTGIVRGQTYSDHPHETLHLEYEAYQAMAEIKLVQVVDEIRNRFPGVQGVAIIQRIGKMFPGTPTVIVACSAAHRDDGIFEAARYGIDRLKEIVPVWKRENGSAGETWMKGNYYPKPGE